MTWLRPSLARTAALVLALACDAGDETEVALARLEAHLDGLAGALCAGASECRVSPELLAARGVSAGPACAPRLGAVLRLSDSGAGLRRAVRAGRVTVDGGVSAACADRLARSCGALTIALGLDLVELCPEALEGTARAGAACELDADCGDGLQCETADAECGGRCAPRVEAGEPCARDGECARAEGRVAVCVASSTAGTRSCAGVRVLDDGALGGACGATARGQGEVDYVGCAGGAWCDVAADGVGACAAPLAAGAECTPGDGCATGSACVAGACTPFTVVRTAGPACNPAGLVLCDGLEGLRCEDGACVAIGDGAEGAGCSTEVDRGFAPCADGLVCDPVTDRCTAPRESGEPCVRDGECASEVCGDLSGTCIPGCG